MQAMPFRFEMRCASGCVGGLLRGLLLAPKGELARATTQLVFTERVVLVFAHAREATQARRVARVLSAASWLRTLR